MKVTVTYPPVALSELTYPRLAHGVFGTEWIYLLLDEKNAVCLRVPNQHPQPGEFTTHNLSGREFALTRQEASTLGLLKEFHRYNLGVSPKPVKAKTIEQAELPFYFTDSAQPGDVFIANETGRVTNLATGTVCASRNLWHDNGRTTSVLPVGTKIEIEIEEVE
jgi:hypothetical protein